MKTIKLTQGKYAIVDDANYGWLNRYKWFAHLENGTWYAERFDCTTDKRQLVYMHRQILRLSYSDGKITDHINRNGLDNRLCNLRIVTRCQNQFNRKNVKGYCWHKKAKKWQVRIVANNKTHSLGYFSKEKDARNAYLEAKIKYHII